jgi:hypothetical protein
MENLICDQTRGRGDTSKAKFRRAGTVYNTSDDELMFSKERTPDEEWSQRWKAMPHSTTIINDCFLNRTRRIGEVIEGRVSEAEARLQ